MSGVEFIVGAVLGSVPLAVILLEKYAVFSEGLSTVRNPNRALKLPMTRVETQKTAFRVIAIKLLSVITDDRDLISSTMSELTEMARDTNLSSSITPQSTIRTARELKMSSIYHNCVDTLENSFKSCKDTVELIVEVLDILMKKLSKIAEYIQGPASGQSPTPTRALVRRMWGSVTLAVGKSGLRESVDELCKLNSDLHSITNHIIFNLAKVKNDRIEQDAATTREKVASNANKIEMYRQIREASAALYDTLANTWTCGIPNHEGHAAKLCCTDILETKAASNSITLRLALTGHEVSQALHLDSVDSLWLEVVHQEENSYREVPVAVAVEARSEAAETLETTLIRSARSLATKTLGRGVRFRDDAPRTQPNEPAGSGGSGSNNSNNAQDPSSRGQELVEVNSVNLTLGPGPICDQVYLRYLECQPQQCLGYFEQQSRYLQRFYRPPPLESTSLGHPVRLSSVISLFSDNPRSNALPYPAAFHIASSLAASVLQFHSTPWLPKTWCSQDITFFSAEELSVESDLPLSHPYFKIEFAKQKRDKGKGKVSHSQEAAPGQQYAASSQQQVSNIPTGARNPLLFALGIVLIEIGFATPWHALKAEGIRQSPDQLEYQIAEELCKVLLPRRMGRPYTIIVRKCIGCAFELKVPEIDFLGSETLRMAFLVEVVEQLKGLNERTRTVGGLVDW